MIVDIEGVSQIKEQEKRAEKYYTKIHTSNAQIDVAVKLLDEGEIVAIPTETVYGLAANACVEAAVAKIFVAKGRPSDNPLIVHISNMTMLKLITRNVPPIAYTLAEHFWPGPLTMVLPKSSIVPSIVTAGLDTVAVRFPSHKKALYIIERLGFPLAAPSANRSGSPSPTTAQAVYDDLYGRIPAIVDGGPCECGVESTVILVEQDKDSVTLLRPGSITPAMLRAVGVEVVIGHGVLEEVNENDTVLSPGMKHRHYAPNTKVVVVNGSLAEFISYVDNICKSSSEGETDKRIGVMVFKGEEINFSIPCTAYGKEDDPEEQARMLFSELRHIDMMGADIVYARAPAKEGVGLAVYNRLIRAAGFTIVEGK